MSKLNHVLGISGGKDSAALAIYLKDKYPSLVLHITLRIQAKSLKKLIS